MADRLQGVLGVLLLAPACAGGGPSDDVWSSGHDPVSDTAESSTEGSAEDWGEWASTGGDESSDGAGSSGASVEEEPEGDSTGSAETGEPGCETEMSCEQGEVVGSVSGDEGSDKLVVAGDVPGWYLFRVREDNGSVFGADISFTATLESPAGLDFDLYVYVGEEGGSTGCGGILSETSNLMEVEVVHKSWNEGPIADGDDASKWVAVHVETKDGLCVPGSMWTLTFRGNT